MIRLYRPDVRRCPADRAIHAHRTDVRKALIELFQNPVSQASDVARKVLTRVLCKQDIAVERPILDFKNDRHMAAMATQRPDILEPVVSEAAAKAAAPAEATPSPGKAGRGKGVRGGGRTTR